MVCGSINQSGRDGCGGLLELAEPGLSLRLRWARYHRRACQLMTGMSGPIALLTILALIGICESRTSHAPRSQMSHGIYSQLGLEYMNRSAALTVIARQS